MPRRPGWEQGALSAKGQIWGKKVQNWAASFGEVACIEHRLHCHVGTGRGLKIWLQLNREGPLTQD